MRILALVPGGLGDQLLFFPTLTHLHQVYPQAELNVVVEPRATAAYRIFPTVKRVIPFDFKGRNGPADWVNLLGIGREQAYDVGISLGSRWTIGLLLWLMGLPRRIGFTRGKKNFWLTDAVPLNPEQYAAAMYHDLLQGMGIKDNCPPIQVQIARKDLDWAIAEQQQLGLDTTGTGKGYMLIHGGSSQLARQKGINKIYPVGQWQQVIEGVRARQPDLPIVLVQGPEDREWIAQMLQICPQLKVTTPNDFGKLAAMIAAANLMLCTDSAPMHLGVAVQTYVIALFGPTDPAKLLPADPRFIGIKSASGQIADIPPDKILERIWNG